MSKRMPLMLDRASVMDGMDERRKQEKEEKRNKD